jgi:hypothetical protein
VALRGVKWDPSQSSLFIALDPPLPLFFFYFLLAIFALLPNILFTTLSQHR